MSKITYKDERVEFWALVRPATYRDDLNRLNMQQDATKQEYKSNDILVAAVFTYPRLVCCTTAGELIVDGVPCPWPPTLDQLLDSSVDCIDTWFAEVKRLNPSWFVDMESKKKKVK